MKAWRTTAAIATAGVTILTGACAAGASENDRNALEPLQIVTEKGVAKFQVEIADDEAERQHGLMGRAPLPDDRGMLFEFEGETERSFWMKNTPSPLDIVYIDGKGRVVSIARNTTPFDETPIPSYGAAKGVLEIRGGRADELGLKPGDQIRHEFFGSARPN